MTLPPLPAWGELIRNAPIYLGVLALVYLHSWEQSKIRRSYPYTRRSHRRGKRRQRGRP